MEAVPTRLFVALQPTEPTRRALATLAAGVDGVRWARGDQFHLTLRFIGETPPGAEATMADALARVRVKSFFLDLEGVGGFPPRSPPAVLWAGVGTGHPLLHQLRQQVDDNLLTTGVPFPLRPFVPHVTLGKCDRAVPVAVAHWLKRHRDFIGPIWPVDSFHLMASDLHPAGAVHRTLRSYGLNG